MRQRYTTALITGASSGIGWEYARQLAERGANIVVVARRKDRLEVLAKQLTSVQVEVLAADLATDDGVGLVADRITSNPVELLVNNAGVSTVGPVHEQPAEDEAREVALNVVALHRLTHAALRPMVEAGHGGILNVSSMAGEQPLRGLATYAATKAFVTRFSEALHAEVKGSGVHVTVLKPGYVWTEMNPDGPERNSLQGRFWLEADQVARHSLDAVEAGRLYSVPGPHWRAASGLINALPGQLVRGLSTRFSAS